nr:MerR family transcriptional regulator [Streptomyces albus]
MLLDTVGRSSGRKPSAVLIGELARRTGTTTRLLRHYEKTGLLRSHRRANGYRSYDADAEETVRTIRALLAAGLPTRVIRQVLPCTTGGATVLPCPGVLEALRAQLAALDRRAAEMDAARAVLRRTISATEAEAMGREAESVGTEAEATGTGAEVTGTGDARGPV